MTDDKQWNGAIGGGAPPVGNVRIPAKPEPVTEVKPSGKDRVGRIFDQTRDCRDISKHERGVADRPQHAVQQVEFQREIVGEWCVETALSAEIERIIQAMWRAFSGGLPVETMAPENRERFQRMAQAARRELRRSDPQPQQSNEQKDGARRQGKSRLQALRSDDLELLPSDARCASCHQPAAFHRFANHPFLWQHDQLTTEDDARRAAAQKLSDEEQTCRRRAGNRCVTCNQPAPYHHVLCGGSRS